MSARDECGAAVVPGCWDRLRVAVDGGGDPLDDPPVARISWEDAGGQVAQGVQS